MHRLPEVGQLVEKRKSMFIILIVECVRIKSGTVEVWRETDTTTGTISCGREKCSPNI